jgi:hypothetical protein
LLLDFPITFRRIIFLMDIECILFFLLIWSDKKVILKKLTDMKKFKWNKINLNSKINQWILFFKRGKLWTNILILINLGHLISMFQYTNHIFCSNKAETRSSNSALFQ